MAQPPVHSGNYFRAGKHVWATSILTTQNVSVVAREIQDLGLTVYAVSLGIVYLSMDLRCRNRRPQASDSIGLTCAYSRGSIHGTIRCRALWIDRSLVPAHLPLASYAPICVVANDGGLSTVAPSGINILVRAMVDAWITCQCGYSQVSVAQPLI